MAPSEAFTSSGSAASSGVSNKPGCDGHDSNAQAGEVARERQRQRDDPALRRRVGRLPDLPIEGGN